MPWGPSSGRTTPLPRNWPAIRRAILERDGHRCTATRGDTGARCDAPATDVDHIDGLSPAISIEQKTTSKNMRRTLTDD